MDSTQDTSSKIIYDNKHFMMRYFQGDVIYYCKNILNSEELSLIEKERSENAQIELFLEYLAKKPHADLTQFFNHLKEWYPWVYEKLDNTLKAIKRDNPVVKVHMLGGIPNLPPKNVSRVEMLRELKAGLKHMKRRSILVVHGMVGSGKTSLTVEALWDSDIVNSFKEQIYWLTVGPEGANDPSYLLTELNARLPDPIDVLPAPLRLANIELIKRFDQKNWCDSLIVLDDLTDGSLLDIFNIGAKILITSRHKNVIPTHHKSMASFIKVTEGFSLGEAKQLFSQALNVPVSSLPEHHILSIFQLTKGHPFSLSLIVSKFAEEFREDLLSKNDRWDYIINEVLSEKVNRRRSWSYSDMYENSIQLSVDSLQKDEQDYFYKLAVFLQDVNIKPEVLGTLWSVSKNRAEEIMNGFVHKSLAVRKWNEPQNSYVFGVHDLIADFLAKKMDKNEKSLHENFISQYEKLCNDNLSKLPKNDNYIFYYIGYHLMKAGRNEVFGKAYFDLEFLQAKLRVSGPADLISDFKKYHNLIMNGDASLKVKLKSYLNFIEDFGVWISQGVDIVQAALQTQNTSPVHDAGTVLAHSKAIPQYYIHCSLPKEKIIPSSLALKEKSKIGTVCFGSSLNQIIIAFENFSILLYDFKAKQMIRRYEGHTGKITCLNMAPCKTKFLSTSYDHTVRIWALPDLQDGFLTPPHERQVNYISLFDMKVAGKSSEAVLAHDHEVAYASFSKEGQMIASICLNGKITVWKDERKSWENSYYTYKSIDFMNDGIIAVDNHNIVVLSSESGNIIYKVEHPLGTDVLMLKTLRSEQGESVVLVGKSGIIMLEGNKPSPDTMSLPAGLRISNYCSVGPYIAVSMVDHSLYVLRPDNGAIITHLPSQNRKVVNWCVGENAILAGDQEGKVLFYPLEALSSPFTRVKWVSGMEPVLASMDNTHSLIKVTVGGESYCKITEGTEKMDVSEDGRALVTCSKTGKVLYMGQNFEEVHEVYAHKTVPCNIFLLSAADDHIVLLSYAGRGVMIWRSSEKRIRKLFDSVTAIKYAELITYDSKQCIITAPPFALWTLDGVRLSSMDLDTLYSISPEKRLLAVLSTSGIQLFSFDGKKISDPKEESRHVQLISFSPSGSKFCLMDANGTLKVLDCDEMKWTHFRENKIVKKPTCLAVSDSGAVCYGGDGLLSIATMDNITTAVLDPAYISANPNGEDTFAVADKTGGMCIIKEYLINGDV